MFLLFLVYFQFLVSMPFVFIMLVFVSVFHGVEAESIGFIKTKLQPKLKDAELIIQGSFLFLIF